MDRLRDRADLVALVARKAESPACRRACLTGRVEVLGGFDEIPPALLPGWLLNITAKHGTEFLMAVIPDERHHAFRVQSVDKIPWRLWSGKAMAGIPYSIYHGDHPATYAMRQELAAERVFESQAMYQGRDRYAVRSRA